MSTVPWSGGKKKYTFCTLFSLSGLGMVVIDRRHGARCENLWGVTDPSPSSLTGLLTTAPRDVSELVQQSPDCSVEERSVSGPYIVFSVWKRSSSCRNHNIVRVCPGHRGSGTPFASETWRNETPSPQYIIHIINNGSVWKYVSFSEKRPRWTCPVVFSSPPCPDKKNHANLTQNVSPSNFRHQCDDPGIDPMRSPHPWKNCADLTEESYPEAVSDRVLVSSTTHISSPLAIVWTTTTVTHPKQNVNYVIRGSSSPPRVTNPTKTNKCKVFPHQSHCWTVTCARSMGQDYLLTDPSPGTNPPIYPSSLPRVWGKIPRDIFLTKCVTVFNFFSVRCPWY